MFPEFKKKIKLILITDTINSKYKLYYSSNNSIKIKKKLNKDKIKFKIINFKCNILSIFTQEIYNNRCFKSLSIDQICSKKFDGNIFETYNKINLNNLIKFYIIDRNQLHLR